MTACSHLEDMVILHVFWTLFYICIQNKNSSFTNTLKSKSSDYKNDCLNSTCENVSEFLMLF